MSRPTAAVPRVLSIAGTDPTGGAGLQGDLKSIAAHHGYGMGVVTALVAQNTRGVRAVHVPPVAFLREQLDAVSDDVEVDAVKIGMLGSAAVVEVVADWLRRVRPPVVVLDPVMVASSGDRLLDREAEAAVRDLARLADLVTPNVPELAVLAGLSPDQAPGLWEAVLDTAGVLSLHLGTAVLAKGGHLDDETARDALVVEGRVAHLVSTPMLDTTATHGTGCAMSSALATLRATGLPWEDCLDRAKAWLTESLRHGEALRVGHGHGPVDHLVHLRP